MVGGGLLSLLIAGTAEARQVGTTPAPAARAVTQPLFRSGIDLVALTVTVTNGRQEFVSGLSADDFAVYDNGVRQPIAYFASADVPLDLALVVDASASMRGRVELVRRAVAGLLEVMREDDRAALVAFRDTVRLVRPLTGDLPAVDRAIRELSPMGGTALYQALYVSLDLIARDAPGPDLRRRALVVLSDGRDTASLISLEHVLERAKQAGVAIYVVALRSELQISEDGGNYAPSIYGLRQLAVQTGGRSFFPRDMHDIRAIYDLIGAELASQYALGFLPPGPHRGGEWRTVRVRVVGRGGLEPRTRAGYFTNRGIRPAHRSGAP